MTFNSSEEALVHLREKTQATTKAQRELARLANIRIDPNTPEIVAAALLRVALRRELNLQPRTNTVDEDDLFPVDIGVDGRDSMCVEEGWARVAHFWITQRVRAHEKLLLSKGDLAILENGDAAEVSSIGVDGRVYFKGGEGYSAWPDKIKNVVRKENRSAKAKRLRVTAANVASRRASRRLWSEARAQELTEHLVESRLHESVVAEFENVIDHSSDERPIQKYIETHPEILASLVGGNERYCIATKRLGDRFIPDFVLGSADSLGIRWTFVELETPASGIYLKDGTAFNKFARKGLEQVVTWRKWIGENLAHARARRSDSGLGLLDVEADSPAFVVVGRRDRQPANASEAMRLEYRARNNIEVHSYDWLLQRLHGTVKYTGLPALSPFLLSPEKGHLSG